MPSRFLKQALDRVPGRAGNLGQNDILVTFYSGFIVVKLLGALALPLGHLITSP